MKMKIGTIAIACTASLGFAQTTVNYTSTGWQDLGTTTTTGLVGNFLPGWTSLNASPDIGVNVFGAPNQTLSGAANDAAIWLNHFDATGPSAANNEVVGLSLSGFTIGDAYSLDFFATILHQSSFGWAGNNDALDVAIIGADISDWDTTVLNDPGDTDGLNNWVAQSLSFTATSSIVEFQFGANASAPDLGGQTYRHGIDGLSVRRVPAPSAIAMLGLGGLLTTRRRR